MFTTNYCPDQKLEALAKFLDEQMEKLEAMLFDIHLSQTLSVCGIGMDNSIEK